MTNPKKLHDSDIRHECGDHALERGKSYFAKGLVLNMAIKSEGALFVQINATVKGTASNPYKQNIRVVWRPDFSSAEIEGSCSCPLSYNCKHIAAVCCKYQASLSEPWGDESAQCMQWLEALHSKPAEPLDAYQEFIAYILKPGRFPQEFTVDFLITKAKKTGGLSKGRKTNLTSLRYSYSYISYIQPQDEEIAKLLTAFNNNAGNVNISGTTGAITVNKLLQTGRLYWKDCESQALRASGKRKLQFAWQETPEGGYHLDISAEPRAKLLLTEPPYYLDSQQGLVGLLDTGNISTEQLQKLLAAPTVPKQYAEEFSQRLALTAPELHLPTPKPVAMTDIADLAATPALHLSGFMVDGKHYQHYIAVHFRYGDWLCPVAATESHRVLQTASGLIRLQRDSDMEQRCIARLQELGFTELNNLHTGHNTLLLYSPGDTPGSDDINHWAGFLQDQLPELEADGWLIERDSNFLLSFQNVQHWDADISESHNNWFEMRFNITIEGKAYPLLPLIMPVLERYDADNLPERLNIALGNHQYVNLPSLKLKPFLDILYELFDSHADFKGGTLRLSRFNAVSLADLEMHNYGLFSLNGGQALRELGRKLKNFDGIDSVEPPANLHAELRLYQQQGLNWLQFLREYQFGGVLADDMGLGKTLQTLAHLLLEHQQGRLTAPCLIIAPTSLMSNWRREAHRFTPDLKVLILQGSERKQQFDKIKDYHLVLTTYPLLPRDEDILLEHEYYYLILDEAQTIKNPLCKASQIVRQIKTQHRLCLTGTPMENHLGELWAQFDFLMPGFLGNSANFKKRYRTPIEVHGDAQQRQRLSSRINPFMLRRRKQDVATELPPKTEIIRSVPLHPNQAALYESIRLTMEQKIRQAIAQKGLARSHITILDALLKLRQTCCDPRTLALKEAQKINESAKLDLLMEILPEQLEEGRRILLFSQFTRMIGLIENELNARNIGYSKLTGQTRKRDEAIDLFKSGAVDVFLISLKAGGVGLNLTEADTVIIYDPWWNPATENQATDRSHRIGQDKPVFVYKLITENTVEEKILAMQDRKRELAESIYQDGDNEDSIKLTAEDLTALFEPL
ncbi:DEAD/DEAH box helicase [Methylosoma difficile]